ncbi:MAG: radical SAM protein [Planctomycetota bacterium]|nr:radical SAM protein [Planctomycetota bacterium]
MARLDTSDHDRYADGMTYVYPVVSRRARGVSVGINLSPNDACNWRCVYCQVPGLTRGKGPAIDLERLDDELTVMLDDLLDGDFMARRVPEGSRRLNDLAFSGNGEPTGSADFPAAVELAAAQLERRGLIGKVKLVLITNGSLAHKPEVQAALARLAEAGGEVWFKLDAGTDAGLAAINDTSRGIEAQLSGLRAAAERCPTWLQTVLFERDAEVMAGEWREWLANLAVLCAEELPLRGVHLYGIARQVHQPEAAELVRLAPEVLEAYAREVRALGLEVTVNP